MSGGQQVDVFANPVNPSQADLQPLLLDDARRDGRQRADLAAQRLARAQEHDRLPAGPLDRHAEPHAQRSACAGTASRSSTPPASRRSTSRRTTRRASASSGIRAATITRKVFGSYGRYYEADPDGPGDPLLLLSSGSRASSTTARPASSPDPAPRPTSARRRRSSAASPSRPIPNLKNQYLNEYLLGGEREVLPNLSVGIKGIYRNYGRVIEDFLCADDGTYCIGNPGEGIMKQVFTLDYSQHLPGAEAEADLQGRPARRHQALLATTGRAWPRTSTRKLDGNLRRRVRAVHQRRRRSEHLRRLRLLRLLHQRQRPVADHQQRRRCRTTAGTSSRSPASTTRRGSSTSGVSAYWRSGTPLTRYGYSDAYGRYEFFLTQRGAEGRTPGQLRGRRPPRLSDRRSAARSVNLLLDVFNILNAQRPILLDQRWGFQETDNALATLREPELPASRSCERRQHRRGWACGGRSDSEESRYDKRPRQ